MKGAASYIIQKSTDINLATSWAVAGVATRSNFTASGLTVGQRQWFRVAAVGASGQGPWSDPATKVVA